MKNSILNIISNTNAKIIISLTAIGGILQIISRKSGQSDKIESELNTNNQRDKSRLKTVVKFLDENGLLAGLIVGTGSDAFFFNCFNFDGLVKLF